MRLFNLECCNIIDYASRENKASNLERIVGIEEGIRS